MSEVREFDVFRAPLAGVNLIEASAGTGKTWNLTGLYLRLLCERDLGVEQILVVTFTNKATAELGARIRGRIVETLAFLRAGEAATREDDPFVREFVTAMETRARIDRATLTHRLELALAGFEEAAIFTIHGFCQRALAEAAFSAGLPFALELVTDEREVLQGAVRDWWRRRIASGDCHPALASYLLTINDTPERHGAILARSLARPLVQSRWPEGSDAPVAIDTTALEAAYASAHVLWSAEREAIAAGAAIDERIAQSIADWDTWLGVCRAFPLPSPRAKLEPLVRALQRSRARGPAAAAAQRFVAAAQPLLAARTAIVGTLALARLRLLRELVESTGPELRRRKRDARIIAFDDMLYNLYAALTDGAHPALARSLSTRFPVALIDEFQDTDPLQFAIFERLYAAEGAAAFFVGDPKQAIYGFRHADLHAYLRARRSASAAYTLAHNQRSSEGLIVALNGLFGTRPDAFVLPGLDYHPAAMGRKRRTAFHDTTIARAALNVWTFPTSAEGTPLPKSQAPALAVRATAAEIARLIVAGAQGHITLGKRVLEPGDIAVLVRTHAQGSEIKRELATRNVGSVELSQASVFQSPDAEEVERVLRAIDEPARESLVRAALATEMLGFDAARLVAIAGDERELSAYVERFAGYRGLWLERGVGIMYRRLLADEKVGARMLRRPDGERRLTNLLHLGEELQQAAATHESPAALLAWLAARRREGAKDEAAQLRLESDRNLVQIVTIHKAKGLEFPVVFCPFLWNGFTRGPQRIDDAFAYHDADGVAVIDFRSDEELGAACAPIKEAIARERAAEEVRLAYVALTRAIHRCYVVAGTYAKGAKATTAESAQSVVNSLVARAAEPRSADDVAADWHALAERCAPHVDVAPLPSDPGSVVAADQTSPETLTTPPPPEAIAPAWRLTSFSGLAAGAGNEGAADDHDARAALAAGRPGEIPPGIAIDDVLRFPRGPAAGDCLHAIFERIDFTARDGWSAGIAAALARHPQTLGGERALDDALLSRMAARMLDDVLDARLPDGIVLASIGAHERLSELEFSLPCARIGAPALNALLKARGYDVPRLAFRELEGYLKGFIDLVFAHGGRYYVLDWKSNHLGYTPGDYAPDAIAGAMAAHGYHLQHLLYALALDRYLRHRVAGYRYDEHFGGVLYLFVRGVRPDWRNADGSAAGVFHHRPEAATLAAFDALLGPPRTGDEPR